MPDLPLLDRGEADRAVAIFNKLRVPDIPERPRLEDAARPWFREIVAALFGSVNRATRRRMIREIFLLIPKKNNKTTGGGALMITALLMNRRPRAEFLFVGPTQEVADLAFDQADGMIEADDIKQREINGKEGGLKLALHVQRHKKRITFVGTKLRPGTGARLRIKSFSDEILTGPRPAGVMLDEIHLLGKDAAAARIIGQLRGGMMSNLEAFLAMFTTQSDEEPAGLFLSELTRARMIRDGEQQGDMLPILYEFPDDIAESEAWRDPASWPMVNPNLGLSVYQPLLETGWQRALQEGEAEVRRFASQHFNIQIGIALKSNAWKGAKFWEQNADKEQLKAHAAAADKKAARLAELDELLASCEVVAIGSDGGGLDDLYGFFILGRERGAEPVEKRIWRCWAHAWCHESVLEERKEIAPRLLDFQKDGDLTIVEDPGDDSREMADIVMKIDELGLLPERQAIGVDQVGIAEFVEELGRRDFDISPGVRIVGIAQGWKLNGAIKTAERRLAGGRMRHNGSAMMNWVLGNAKVEPKGNAVTINKQISGAAKIDPLMAGFNAVTLMSLNPDPSGAFTADYQLPVWA